MAKKLKGGDPALQTIRMAGQSGLRGEMFYPATRGSGVDCEQGGQSFSLQHRLDFALCEV